MKNFKIKTVFNNAMNFKKITLLGFFIFLLIPSVNAIAFTHIDYIKDGNYAFFLFDLEEDNNIELSVNHDGSGNFTLFLFNNRPTESNVNNDKTLNYKIFMNPSIVAYNLDDDPYINYTAPETKIYYIEIILVGGGPDTFTLSSTTRLTRYYLPIIPGFQIELIIFTLILSVGLILILYKKRIKK